jgi:hypothetical protein
MSDTATPNLPSRDFDKTSQFDLAASNHSRGVRQDHSHSCA